MEIKRSGSQPFGKRPPVRIDPAFHKIFVLAVLSR
jgi:hypothetical protein